jgi:hypothetical protein
MQNHRNGGKWYCLALRKPNGAADSEICRRQKMHIRGNCPCGLTLWNPLQSDFAVEGFAGAEDLGNGIGRLGLGRCKSAAEMKTAGKDAGATRVKSREYDESPGDDD